MTTRRTSLRLSGGSSTAQLTPESSRAAKGKQPGGDVNNKETGTRKRKSSGLEEEAVIGKKKRLTEMKPTTTKRSKPSTFNPVPLPSLPAPIDASAPLPPPPPERRPARRRSSARGMADPSDSPLVVPMPAKKPRTVPPKAPAAAGKGKEVGGLDLDGTGGSLEKELEGERKRWEGLGLGVDGHVSVVPQKGQPQQSTPTKPTSSLDFLTFETPSRPLISGARPTTPHRAYLTAFATPHTKTKPKTSARAKPRPTASTTAGGAAAYAAQAALAEQAGGDRSRDVVVPIEQGGTPVIKRNQEMREKAGGRRSSLGLRGVRMSESLGKGDISTPHAAVPYSTFFKHAAPVLPEPVRTRHLLIWLGKRATEGAVPDTQLTIGDKGKGKGKGKDKKDKGKGKEEGSKEGEEAVKAIMERVWVGLAKGEVDTNVFAPSGQKNEAAGKLRPHPANVANLEFQRSANETLAEARKEEDLWSRLVLLANARLDATTARRAVRARQTEQERAEPRWVGEEGEVERRKTWWRVAGEVLGMEDGERGMMEEGEVEYKVDTLHQASHATLQFSLQATRFMDGIFSSLNADLRSRDNAGLHPPATTSNNPLSLLPSSSSSGPSNPINLLRALAAAEAGQQSEATVAQASQLQPLPRAQVPLGVMTPRKAGQTPRRAGAGLGTPGTGGRRGPYGRPGSPS